MKYLYKMFLFGSKVQLNISTSCIDYMTYFKKDKTLVGTRLVLSFKKDFCQICDGQPDYTNRALFNDLFFKVTVQYAAEDGSTKNYSAWINPENIVYLHAELPGSSICFFKGGNCLALAKIEKDLMTELLEHNKRYAERMKGLYGKK